MTGLLEYVLKEVKAKRLSKTAAMALVKEEKFGFEENKHSNTGEKGLYVFEECWVPEPLPESSNAPVGTLVCILSDQQWQNGLQIAMQQSCPDLKLIFISELERSQKASNTTYRLKSLTTEGYSEVFEEVASDHDNVIGLAYMLPLENQDHVFETEHIFHLLKGLVPSKLRVKSLLLCGEHQDDIKQVYLESWLGFERSTGIFLPDMKTCCLFHENTQHNTPSIDYWSDLLTATLGAQDFSSALYRGGLRHRCKTVQKDSLNATGIAQMQQRGTYLVTGGLGGIGFLFCEYLAKQYSANLILTGRSPLDSSKKESIRHLESYGASVHYIQADIADSTAMQKGIDSVMNGLKNIDGVIHSAGISGAMSILDKDFDYHKKVLATKIPGTLVLDKVLSAFEVKFVCYFSSVAAVLGDFGSCDYAIGNRFQMAYAAYRNQKGITGGFHGNAVCINWPLWDEGGMNLAEDAGLEMYLQSTKQAVLTTDDGIALFEKLIGQPDAHHTVLNGEVESLRGMLKMTPTVAAKTKPETVTTPEVKKPQKKQVQSIPSENNKNVKTMSNTKKNVESQILSDLKSLIEGLLKMPVSRIDSKAYLSDFGFDSISLTHFAKVLSEHYDHTFSPSVFFSYPTLEKLKEHLNADYGELMQGFYNKHQAPEVEQAAPEIAQVSPEVTAVPDRQDEERSESIDAALSEEAPDVPNPLLEPIAIVGMSGRFPEAENTEALWELLSKGESAIKEISSERFDWKKYYGDPLKDPSKTNCKWMGAVPGVKEFDPAFFGISPREANDMDPRQRLLLQESWKALEDAGYGPDDLNAKTVGMFVGVEQGDYLQVSGGAGNVTSNHDGILSSRLAYLLDFKGPVLAINTACSSGLVAAHQACQSLRNGECDTMLAAGVNLVLSPEAFVTMGQAGMLSSDGKCHTFDKKANGMVPSEAVVVVVLKRLSQAKADGDPIHAVIKGSGVNYDGNTNGITAPNGASQATLMKSVYQKYKIDPEEISYVVTHGTGTRLGDPVEVNALQDTYRSLTQKKNYCALTSTKTNFGHTFAASGLLSLVSLVKSLQTKSIPASLNCDEENEFINWNDSPFYVNKSLKPWPDTAEGTARNGAISAFGMSGTNAHMVISDYPTVSNRQRRELPRYILPFSAKSAESLKAAVDKMVTHLESESVVDKDLTDISYTMLSGRHHFGHRYAIVVSNAKEAVDTLKEYGKEGYLPNAFEGQVPRGFDGKRTIKKFISVLSSESADQYDDPTAYDESMSDLAEFYVQGYDLPSDRLFNNLSIRKVHLPTYTFSKQHYWVKEKKKKADVAIKLPQKESVVQITPHITQSEERSIHRKTTNGVKRTGLKRELPTVPKTTLKDNSDTYPQISLADTAQIATSTANENGARSIHGTKAHSVMPTPLQSAYNKDFEVRKASSNGLHGTAKTDTVVRKTVLLSTIEDWLCTSLAEALFIDVDSIGMEQQFVDLGLDSIIGVEWVRAINVNYNISLSATMLYDYPTVSELSIFLQGEINDGESASDTSEERQSTILASPEPIAVASPTPTSNGQVEVVQQETVSLSSIEDWLCSSLAEALFIDVDSIGMEQQFVDLGLDSIIGVEWVRAINIEYSASLSATLLYDYPTISELAKFISKELQFSDEPLDKYPTAQAPEIGTHTYYNNAPVQDDARDAYSLEEILQKVEQGVMDANSADHLFVDSYVQDNNGQGTSAITATAHHVEIAEVIVQHLKEVIPELADQQIVSNDSLRELGANSVDRAEIIMKSLATLSIEVPLTSLTGASNITELAELMGEAS